MGTLQSGKWGDGNSIRPVLRRYQVRISQLIIKGPSSLVLLYGHEKKTAFRGVHTAEWGN